MKLLFDQNLSPRLVDSLADVFSGSLHIQIRRGNCSTAAIEAMLRKHADHIDALALDKDAGFLILL